MKKIAGRPGYEAEIVDVSGQGKALRWKRSSVSKLNTKSMSRALLQGDTHAEVKAAAEANRIAEEEGVDVIIQTGDFADGYDSLEKGRLFLEECSRGPVPWVFIRGNHDDTNWLRKHNNGELVGDTPVEIKPNVWWCPDGTVLEFATKRVLMVGGAVSVNSSDLKLGIEYWEDETTPQALLYKEIPKVDIVISHDAPTETAYKVIKGTWKEDAASVSNRELLQIIFDESEADTLIHGHYHHGHITEHDGKTIIGLAHEQKDHSKAVFEL